MNLNHLENNNACVFTYGSEFNPVWEHPAALNLKNSLTGLTVWCDVPTSLPLTPVFNTLRAAVRFLRRGMPGTIDCPPETAYYVNSVSLMEWAEMSPDTRRAYLKKVTLDEVEAAKAKAADEEMPELSFRELALADAGMTYLDCFLREEAAERALEYWPFEGFGHSGQILAAIQHRKQFYQLSEEDPGTFVPYIRVLIIDRIKHRGYVWDAYQDTYGAPIQKLLPQAWWDIWTRHEVSAIKKALVDARTKKDY